jgi:hypothetical protein
MICFSIISLRSPYFWFPPVWVVFSVRSAQVARISTYVLRSIHGCICVCPNIPISVDLFDSLAGARTLSSSRTCGVCWCGGPPWN